MVTFAEQIYDIAKTLPINQANEVLNFIYDLKTKMPLENSQSFAEENVIKGILERRNQRKLVSTDYLQQLREEGRP
jgi:hypothetical protein